MSTRALCGCTVPPSNQEMAANKEEEANYTKEDEVFNVDNNIKSKFVQQICSILLVARILDWYQDLKTKNPLLSSAFSPIEFLVTAPLLFVAGQFGTRFKGIDEKAAQITATMTDAVGQFYHQALNTNVHSPVKSSNGKCVVRSFTGTAITWCVDTIYYISENVLRKLKTHSQRKPLEEALQKQFVLQGFHNHGLLYVVVLPLEIYVAFLRYLHRWIHNSDASVPPQEILSPEKWAEIQSRRKVSPRKKSKNILMRLFSLGKPGTLQSISEELKGELSKSPNKDDGMEKKRKFEDIETEQESDENYGLGDSDLENYDSNEDPDYEPVDHNTTDSEEYEEGQTESDIEFEVKGTGYQVVEYSAQAVTKEVVVEDAPVKSDSPSEKPLSKSLVEGTPPAKTSTPRTKPGPVLVETKPETHSCTTDTKITLSPGKPIQVKTAFSPSKVKEDGKKNVEENATIQIPANTSTTEKKAVLQPGKSIQLKPSSPQIKASSQVKASSPQVKASAPQVKATSPQVKATSPQVKARESKERSGQTKSENYHVKCKEDESVGLRLQTVTSSPQRLPPKSLKHKGGKKIENQASTKETKTKGSTGNDAGGDKKLGEKQNGEKPKTEIKNINIAGGDYLSKESEID